MEVDKALLFHVAHPLVEIEVLDATSVKGRRAAQYAVHFVTFVD